MNIVKLDSSHIELVKKLYQEVKLFVDDNPSPGMRQAYCENFCNSYLSGLDSYHAYGAIINNELVAAIGFYESSDDAAWYLVQLLSTGAIEPIRSTLDVVIAHNENRGRLKFYSMFPADFAKAARRLVFSEVNILRYDYFDEFFVEPKARCIHNTAWQVLYERVLHPKKTIVRCSFLKQQHRFELVNASGAY